MLRCALVLLILNCLALSVSADETPSFVGDIAPLLVRHCVACHGPKNPQGEYQLHTWKRANIAGTSGETPLVAGKPDQGEWLRLIRHADPEQRMPQQRPALSAAEIQLIERWIAAGAKYDHADPDANLLLIAKRPTNVPAPVNYAQPIPLKAMALYADQVLIGGYHELTAWSRSDGKLVQRYPGLQQRTLGMAMHPDQRHVAIAGGEPGSWGVVLIYDLEQKQVVSQLAVATDVYQAVAWNKSGTQLVAVGSDRTLTLWQWPERKQLWQVEAHADWVHSITWSNDEQLLLTTSRDKTARLFRAKDGELTESYNDEDQPLLAGVFAPDNKWVITAGLERQATEWSVNNGEKFKPKPNKEESQDAKKQQAAQLAARANPFAQGNQSIMAMLRIEQQLFIAQGDRVRLFEYATRKETRSWSGAAGAILTIASDATTEDIVAGDQAGQVTIWSKMDDQPRLKFTAKP
jgi:mono/diheme cytochrome c family protein